MLASKTLALAAATALTLAAGAAWAGPIPDAYMTTDGPDHLALGTYAIAPSVAAVGLANSGDPSLSVSAQSSATAEGHGGSISLFYFYEVNGPANTYVPVTITGSLSFTGQGLATGTAILNWANGGVDTENFGAGATRIDGLVEPGLDFEPTASVKQTYDVLSDTVLTIGMFALATAGSPSLVAGAGTAFIDPIITVDPTFAAQGFSLEESPNLFSPGGGGGGAVPEPATWALMIGGFGLAGAALRRRQPATMQRP